MKSLANVYDFDHTIYRGDASLDFIVFCMRRHPSLIYYLPADCIAIFLYLVGIWDRKQIKQVAFAFLKSIKNIDQELEIFWAHNEQKLEDWYLKQKQPSDVIISASPEFLLRPIITKLGVDIMIATRMNKRTGKIEGENCRAGEKVTRLLQINPNPSFLNAYSDSLSDLPLLKLAQNPYIVHKGIVTKLKAK